ncbi:MAG: NBR1-Ig-like domain-containing protein [Chloroflexi bacterium]|nr:NBR1-Ig-like domain-containing protein [Chloroflexota bacterium]
MRVRTWFFISSRLKQIAYGLWLMASLATACAPAGNIEPSPTTPAQVAPTLAATAAPPPTPLPAPTEASLPTEPAASPRYPTPAATLPAAERVGEARFAGVSFFYDEALLAGIRPTTTPAHTHAYALAGPSPADYYYGVPDYLLLEQVRVDEHNSAFPPLLVIQPLRTAEGDFFTGYPVALTEEWLAWESHLVNQTVPVDELGAELAHPRFLETGNGRGLRFITPFAYVFRGVTEDGRYALWWEYPLVVPPNTPLETLSASDFSPDLRQLDLMVQTLFVNSEASTASSVPLPEPNCTPDARFVADVTIPDGTTIAPRTTFTKTWRVQNTGTCTWSAAYVVQPSEWPEPTSLLFGIYESAALAQPLPVVPPGGTAEISLLVETPPLPGYYLFSWQLLPPQPPVGQSAAFPPAQKFGTTLHTEVRVDQIAPVAIPQDQWRVAEGESAAYPAGTAVFFGPDEIRLGNEAVCAPVRLTGRFVTGSERTNFLPLLPPSLHEPLPPYLELVETDCTWPGLSQFILLDEFTAALALPNGFLYLTKVQSTNDE